MTILNLKIIRTYGFKEKTYNSDWDDVCVDFTLPNGIELTTMIICNKQACESNCLEGLDGYIYIETQEELEELINKSYEEVLHQLKNKHPNFEIDDYL